MPLFFLSRVSRCSLNELIYIVRILHHLALIEWNWYRTVAQTKQVLPRCLWRKCRLHLTWHNQGVVKSIIAFRHAWKLKWFRIIVRAVLFDIMSYSRLYCLHIQSHFVCLHSKIKAKPQDGIYHKSRFWSAGRMRRLIGVFSRSLIVI